jgi:hypothetical protein
MRRRRFDNEEGTIFEDWSGFAKALVAIYKSPNPTERVVLRLQYAVSRPIELCKFLNTLFIEKQGVVGFDL